MLTNFNRIYAVEIDVNSLTTTYDSKAIYSEDDKNTSTLLIRLLNNGEVFDVNGCNVVAYFKCPDGEIYIQDCILLEDELGCVALDLKKDVLQVGDTTLSLKITKDRTDDIRTPNITYKVVQGIEGGVPSTDERLTVLGQAIQDVNNVKHQIEDLILELEVTQSDIDDVLSMVGGL